MRRFLIVSFVLAVSGVLHAQARTVATVIASEPNLSTLFTLVSTANLLDVLADESAEYTVFAPTNAAFEALPAGVAQMILSDPALLTRVLTYHVAAGRIESGALTAGEAIDTMEMEGVGLALTGSQIDVTVPVLGAAVKVGGAKIVTADIEASNGIVHIVDRVLLPPDVAPSLGTITSWASFVLFGTLNPPGADSDEIFYADASLEGEIGLGLGFFDIVSVQSVAFDSAGNAYVTIDTAANADGATTEGALFILPGFGNGEPSEPPYIAGPNTGIVSPKGLQVLETLGVVAIADNGAKNIKLFALDAEGDTAPVATISLGAEGGVWDVWYDLPNDTLYAAKTNGELAAYDGFSERLGADGPTRMIVPTDADGNKISVNLHGIDVDYDSNIVIVSDIGSGQAGDDGQIFVLFAASIADGPTPVDARIAGDQTGLGNPADLIFDGSGIYVAEKFNDRILYFADILSAAGDMNIAPDASQPATKPESVAIYPTRESAIIAGLGQ